jgi:hypothetical protein
MVDLAGELIAFPLPNKPGMWAYRKLASDEVLVRYISAPVHEVQFAAICEWDD